MKTTALIMAGGRGERFWPVSRTRCPKQFLSLTDDGETMIQKTVRRLHGIAAPEDTFVVTNASYLPLLHEQLPALPQENILAEPCARNTAACIALAAGIVCRKYGDAVMLVLPADHLIRKEQAYREAIRQGLSAAEGGALVTLGIRPDYPETGYGYLRCAPPDPATNICRVERFLEKPDLPAARRCIAEGWLWNSGMFLWKASAILTALRQYQPALYQTLLSAAEAWNTPAFTPLLAEIYPTLPSVSIDTGVLEQADNICAVPCDPGWDDVGSWRALDRISAADRVGNIVSGDVVTVDSSGCTVSGSERLIAVLGLQEVVIVDTPDALLVCSKDSTQDIKKLLSALRMQHREAVL